MSGLTPTMVWAMIGMTLLVIEIFTLSFGVVFFGVAALVVALLKAATGLDHWGTEILVFAGLGFSGLLLFRRKIMTALGKQAEFTPDRHKIIELTADIPPRSSAKVEYQGVAWDAYNDSTTPLKRGDKAQVLDTEGIKLIVRPLA